MRRFGRFGAQLVGGALFMTLGIGAGCIGSSTGNGNGGGSTSRPADGQSARRSDLLRRHPLDKLPTATIQANDHALRVWLAIESDEQSEGLMHVPAEEIADDQGMLFVFPDEALRFFWMRNTITSLDIAYARMDGTIVRTWTMPPLTLQSYPSGEPAMFALEMKAGAFDRLKIKEGDKLVIPDEVLKAAP